MEVKSIEGKNTKIRELEQLSAERIAEIKEMIAERQRKISEGLPVDRKEVAELQIMQYREELAELERSETESQELVFDEVTEEAKPEEILTDIYGEPLEFYTDTLGGATLIRQKVRTMIEHERSVEKEKTEGYKQLYQNEQTVNAELSRNYNALEERYDALDLKYNTVLVSENELLGERNEYKLKATDFESKFNAATNRIEEIEQELKNAWIEVNRNRQFTAQTEEEQTAAIEAAKKDIKDSIIEVYNIRPKEGEFPSVTLVCNIAATGEELEFHYYKKGKHKDIGLEAALNLQAMNKPPEIPPIDEVVNQEQFQSEGESTQDLDATEDCTEQREASEVEPESFEQEMRRRVGALERKLDKNEPEFFHEVA